MKSISGWKTQSSDCLSTALTTLTIHSTARVAPVAIALALLPGIALAGHYEISAYRSVGRLGFPLDDSWIHAQFARNLAHGNGFTYTGPHWVSGSTAPLWTVLLSLGHFSFGGAVTAAIVLGIACQAATGYFAIRVAGSLGVTPSLSCLAGALAAVLPVMVWGAVSGMEVPLAAALVMAGLWRLFGAPTAKPPVSAVAVLALAALARPESLILVVVAIGSELFGDAPWRQRLRRTAQLSAVAAAVISPLLIFSWLSIGRLLPTTFYAKSGPGIVRAMEAGDGQMAWRAVDTFGPRAVGNLGLILFDQFGWPIFIAGLGLLACLWSPALRRAGCILVVMVLAASFMMGLVAPQRLKPDNVRYAAQLIAPASPLVILGIQRIVGRRLAALALAFAVVGWTAWRTADRTAMFTLSVKNITELHVRAGEWMRDNLPTGAEVAVNDVGAIAFFSGHPILDLEGLVSPEALAYRQTPERGLKVVLAHHPDYLAIFPHWYPDIVARSDLFTEVRRFQIDANLVSAGDTLILYRTPWADEPQPERK